MGRAVEILLPTSGRKRALDTVVSDVWAGPSGSVRTAAPAGRDVAKFAAHGVDSPDAGLELIFVVPPTILGRGSLLPEL